ncbi:hypothetical protein GTA08_BOTSDO01405 [Neofusicoccum parvum]|uniref:Glycosyltransferase family 25 protein n=2 Tax=Neofusicoccum parvum TaxID=310453 RepID=R1GEY3_BOTPV|nr:hypothetical protein UCRNP2_6459 [Neofusicoccum parvum UCRNP2]GME41793.1 hypothetical protein GTA08_BOTSDO01405 [Neofusicoccum parvum]GME60435.1 hypothetical protein GTA08_BOTSDO01405 [Neofusicoccum parvum]
MEPRFQRLAAVLIFLVVSLSLWFHSPSLGHGSAANQASAKPPPQPFTAGLNYTRLHPANATLGFGAVLAVSRQHSPRQEALFFASNLTGVHITVPRQPQWSDDDLNELKADADSRITRGSALAWLGHLNALKWFLDSGLETALVLEDDVDWDIHLRSIQVPLASENLRSLLGSDKTYWSDPSQWEILYLGHCGDFFGADKFDDLQHRVYRDDTLLPHRRMHSHTKDFLDKLGLEEGERMIHRSKWPLCTFGYAVTRASAHRILTELAAKETEGGCDAFDVRILEACRDLDYQCYSANPELFHHISAPSEIADVNEGIDSTGRLQSQKFVSGTTNIACGARSESFFTKDPATLKYLQKEVGEKGHCLMDPMEQDSDKPF